MQDELAQLLGGSRQRINVELKWMQREGIIGIHQRNIVIHDQARLETLAQQEVTQHGSQLPPPGDGAGQDDE